MNSTLEVIFRDLYYADTPSLWWRLDRPALHLQVPGRFDLLMRPVPKDDDLLDDDDKARSVVVFSQTIEVSEALEKVLRRIAATPPLEAWKASTNPRPQVGTIPDHPRYQTLPWITEANWKELLVLKRTLERSALDALNCYFWRLGLLAGPSVLESWLDHFEFRFGDDAYHKLPVARVHEIGDLIGESTPPINDSAAQGFLQERYSAPLHHSLFQEALRRSGEPRVSFIMAVVAAESAIKFLIAQCIPQAQWLVENVPSPPIKKLIRDFLPTLECKCTLSGVVVAPIPSELNIIEKAFDLRNKIVHGVDAELNIALVESTLSAVRNFLALVDFYGGEEWAFENISKSTQAQLRVAADEKRQNSKHFA